MWPFNKLRRTKSIPVSKSAVKDYYQTAKPERMWLVWLLSIGTFIVTALVVFGLFWSGRWLVHRFDNDKPTKPTPIADKPTSNQPITKPQPVQNPNPPTNNPPASSSQPTASAPTATTTPRTGDLPHTGPDSDE